MVAVQAVAGSIINKAIRVLHQKMTKVVKMEWEDALAAFGKLSDIPETALHINRGEMKLSAIPKPALYIKRGEKTVVYQADITGYRRIRVVSGSYQPNISSKTLYQGLADISLIYQADTMVVRPDATALALDPRRLEGRLAGRD